MIDGYARWAPQYRSRLWMGVLPLPPRAKKHPPSGYTGKDGVYPDDPKIEEWRNRWVNGNIALRMPGDVLGIDVDDYEYWYQTRDPDTNEPLYDDNGDPVMAVGVKTGNVTLGGLEDELGPLPDTWRSSSRGDGPSGIRFFRVPSGLLWGDFGLHLEGIWWKHRYAVVYPSINPDSEKRYEWINDGAHEPQWGVEPPKVTDLSDLPESWVARFGRAAEADGTGVVRTAAAARAGSNALPPTGDRKFTRKQAAEFVQPELDKLRGAVLGEINDRLNDAAITLSHFVPTFWSDAAARALLQDALSATVYDDPRSADATIRSGLSAVTWVAELVPDKPAKVTQAPPPVSPPRDSQEWETEPPEVDEEETWPLPQRPGQDLARQVEPYSPEFPIHHLPHELRRFVHEVSASLQVPVTLTALACLSAVAIVAGPRARIRQRPDFIENLNLATLVALPPGSLKSPTYRVVREPLKRIEREMQERFDEQRDQIMEEMQGRLDDDDLSDVVKDKIKREMKLLEKLVSRMFVQNATPEAMEQLAARNGGVVNMLDSEGSALGNIAGRYNKGVANLEFVLAAYDCDEYTIDRVSSGSRYIERTCMTAGLTTQPEVLYELHDPKTRMGERGFLGRLVCALPQPIDDRTVDPPQITTVAVNGWNEVLRQVGRLPIAPIHDPLHRYGPESGVIGVDMLPPIMTLSPEAMELHLGFEKRINELKHGQTGALAYMADWVAKHYGRCLRIAGLLHLVQGNGVGHPVGRATMQDAIGISWWMVQCAQVVYGRWTDPGAAVEVDQIRAVSDWWTRAGCPERFTLREALRGLHGRKWAKNAGALKPVMQTLADLDWWRPMEGPRKQVVYVVNPMLAEALTVTKPLHEQGVTDDGS